MPGRGPSLLVFLLASIASLRAAAEEPAVLFNERRAFETIKVIASDDFAGRKSGLRGGRSIEEYVARQFEASGLEPCGDNATYFHSFPMLATEERGASMELLDSPYGRVPFLYGDDFTLVTNSGSGDVTSEVIVVGHGLSDTSRAWNDYGTADVRGRIVFIVRGTPKNGFDWDQEGSRDSTLHEAVRRGAVAVLYVQEARPVNGGAVHEGSYFPTVPVAYVGHRVADLLFIDSGLDREAYEAEIASAPHPFATGKRLRIKTDVRQIRDGSARNVVGRLVGSDPALRVEVILVGGHMDHIGTDGRGLVFNGANDNGSGTAVVLELARAIASRPQTPRRTLIFTAFAAEEQGLLGSEALAARPPFDLGGSVAMLNFDMAGHGSGITAIGGGEQYPEVMRAFVATLDSTEAESVLVRRAWGGEGSDHAPFRRAGIPTFNIWSEGDHHFYHRLDDDPAWIDTTALGHTGRTVERWIRFLADWPTPLRAEHSAGRAMLRSSVQVDFDGGPPAPLPDCVIGRVEWLEADEFARDGFLDDVARLAERDSIAIVDALSGIEGPAWDGKRSVIFGVEGGAVGRGALLRDLHVRLVRGLDPAATRDRLPVFAKEGVAFVIEPDTSWVAALPKGAKAYVRAAANRLPADVGAFPRGRFFFIVSLDGPMPAGELTRWIAGVGWDRVHLDLVPWIRAGGDGEIPAFLEELRAPGRFEHRHLDALLGGNLEKM